jgi:hypothetical protein
MSTYNRKTKHPVTGIYENATWQDDLFGNHKYGVIFPSDANEINLEKYVGTEEWGIMARTIAFDPRKDILSTLIGDEK